MLVLSEPRCYLASGRSCEPCRAATRRPLLAPLRGHVVRNLFLAVLSLPLAGMATLWGWSAAVWRCCLPPYLNCPVEFRVCSRPAVTADSFRDNPGLKPSTRAEERPARASTHVLWDGESKS